MPPQSGLIHVVCAAVIDADGRVLLARRPDHTHQGGLWEFPGGKLEADEDARAALARELAEEVGIAVREARPLIRIRHDYGDRCVLLDAWRVEAFDGVAHGREGQPVEWVAPEALVERDMPAANIPIVNAVRLPALYLITGEPAERRQVFLARLVQALERGIRLVQLRARTLSAGDYLDLAREVVPMCHRYNAKVLLNSDPAWVEETGADGVQLSGERLAALERRPLTGPRYWVGASVHNVVQLQKAEALGVDFVVASPVLPTPSHPDACPLGWKGLHDLTELATVPMYALGGLARSDLDQAFLHGAQGIAAIRDLWGGAS